MSPAQQFQVPFTLDRFAAGTVARTSPLQFSGASLAHALFVTGRAPGDQARHGMSSVWEFIHRTSLIPSYIRRGPGRALVRSALATELDRSEKVALSYAMGQAMTGVFCRQILGVRHMLHVDRYERRYSVTFGAGRRRPDLFGRGPGGWVVAESKGRSNAMESALRDKLIAQKRMVATINGAAPTIAVGCVAAFPPPAGSLVVHAFDPPDDERDAIRVRIDLDRYLLAYYEPFVAAVDFGTVNDDAPGIRTSAIGPDGLRVGLHEELYAAVREHQNQHEGFASIVDRIVSRSPGEFGDGTVVAVDWSESLSNPDWAVESR